MVTIKYSSPTAIKEHNYFVFVTLVTRQLTVFSNNEKRYKWLTLIHFGRRQVGQ